MAKSKVNELPKLEDVKDAKFTPVTEGVELSGMVAKDIIPEEEQENADETANENVTNESNKAWMDSLSGGGVVSVKDGFLVETFEKEGGIDTITSENGS